MTPILLKKLQHFLLTYIPHVIEYQQYRSAYILLGFFLCTYMLMVFFIFLLNLYDVFYRTISIENKTFLCKHVIFLTFLWGYTLFVLSFCLGVPVMISFIVWPLLFVYMYILYRYRPVDFLFFYFKVQGHLPLYFYFLYTVFCGYVAFLDINTIQGMLQVQHVQLSTGLPTTFVCEVTGEPSFVITKDGEMYPIEKEKEVEIQREPDGKTVLPSPGEDERDTL